MSDGASIYECRSADEVIDLVRGGQGVFGIAVGRVWEEVEGTLATLPTYQPGRPIEEVAREIGRPASDIIKLASNENPLGTSPAARAAYAAAPDEPYAYTPEAKGHRRVIYLGDMINRGPDSVGVLQRWAQDAERHGVDHVDRLMGNHEQTLLQFLDTPEGGPIWAEFGGGETLASYGVARPVGRDPEAWRAAQDIAAQDQLSILVDLERSIESLDEITRGR